MELIDMTLFQLFNMFAIGFWTAMCTMKICLHKEQYNWEIRLLAGLVEVVTVAWTLGIAMWIVALGIGRLTQWW